MENKQPKKMGRPRIGAEPMTSAQRHKRYREKRKREVAELVQLYNASKLSQT
jgi:hypothetical protein